MQVIKVQSAGEIKEFHDFPRWLYKDDPFWICPLDSSVEATFDPGKNHFFSHGEAVRWLLKDESSKTIGRIAAFVDTIRSAACRQPTGGVGFFEVIEKRDAAFLLFDTAKKWLADRGMEAMDGPVTFGENFVDWG